MELEKVRVIISEKYAELSGEVITRLRQTGPENAENPAFAYANFWEEFVDQVQEDQASPYSAAEDPVEQACRAGLARLSATELKLLWLGSGGCVTWDEAAADVDFPAYERIREDVLDELYSWVEQKALEDEPVDAAQDALAPER